MLQVVSQVDRGHAAFTKLTLDGVAAVESGIQAGDGVGHQFERRLGIRVPDVMTYSPRPVRQPAEQ